MHIYPSVTCIFFFPIAMKHGKQGGNWLQRSTVEQKGLKHKEESQHTTTTCSINTAHTYLWVMEADTRLDWHVLVWALRSLPRPTANKERETLPLIFLINFSLKIPSRNVLIKILGWEWKCTPLTARHKAPSQFSVFMHWRLQVSTSHLCELHTGPRLAPNYLWCHKCRLYVHMSDLRWAQRNFPSFSRWMWKQPSRAKLCTYIILHSEAQTSK